MIKIVAYAPERGCALEAIRSLLIMEWSPRSAAPMPATTRRMLASRLELKPRHRSCPGPGATRISTGDSADVVVLDSTTTPAAVMIGGIWIGLG